jgi:hypothetical protein
LVYKKTKGAFRLRSFQFWDKTNGIMLSSQPLKLDAVWLPAYQPAHCRIKRGLGLTSRGVRVVGSGFPKEKRGIFANALDMGVLHWQPVKGTAEAGRLHQINGGFPGPTHERAPSKLQF